LVKFLRIPRHAKERYISIIVKYQFYKLADLQNN